MECIRMGYDMLLATIAVPTKIDYNLEEAFTKIKKMVETMTKKEIAEYANNKYYIECEMNDEVLKQIKKEILENIELLRSILIEGARDTTNFCHKGYIIYATGGLSYGDSPTDSYDVFNDFYYLPMRITGVLDGVYEQ